MKNGGAPSTRNSRCKGPELGMCDLDKVQQIGSPHGWGMREKGPAPFPLFSYSPASGWARGLSRSHTSAQ